MNFRNTIRQKEYRIKLLNFISSGKKFLRQNCVLLYANINKENKKMTKFQFFIPDFNFNFKKRFPKIR